MPLPNDYLIIDSSRSPDYQLERIPIGLFYFVEILTPSEYENDTNCETSRIEHLIETYYLRCTRTLCKLVNKFNIEGNLSRFSPACVCFISVLTILLSDPTPRRDSFCSTAVSVEATRNGANWISCVHTTNDATLNAVHKNRRILKTRDIKNFELIFARNIDVHAKFFERDKITFKRYSF
ncbi:hypothetical protein PUN28_006488 [Cardiocondyla obscurior]|uniref:Uncharacterized protein n=1 Tax=Cardiocondyla obscurior TaxID=286306 RepID=A0AAW2GDV4_9HYME